MFRDTLICLGVRIAKNDNRELFWTQHYLSVKGIDLIVEADGQVAGGWGHQIGHDWGRVLIDVK